MIKSIGSSKDKNEVDNLVIQAQEEIRKMSSLQSMFVFEKDQFILDFLQNISNHQIKTVGPELIFGKIYDKIAYNAIEDRLFRYLVISRLSFPLSKLKTVDYLQRYLGVEVKVDKIYRFMDKLSDRYKSQVEQISFKRTKELLNSEIGIVFYDMTTLYFEASDEDELRQPGFSKDGKHSNPQIFLGLLVGLEGYAIGYDIFEGGIYEGHTLIPFIEQIKAKFDIDKPIIVADSGLLNQKNINCLKELGYQFILGGRVKNESEVIKY
ncbi:MAG TPA: IS1634 family transposase [Candidatus Kapabacteria bacterium]|nr:IS1634 family transposase [Candidatus Kapabacteria bacterium]